MALIKTSNPALSNKTFTNLADAQYGVTIDAANRMTLSGTVNKTAFCWSARWRPPPGPGACSCNRETWQR